MTDGAYLVAQILQLCLVGECLCFEGHWWWKIHVWWWKIHVWWWVLWCAREQIVGAREGQLMLVCLLSNVEGIHKH